MIINKKVHSVALGLTLLLLCFVSMSNAQLERIQLNFETYEVIYLTDFVDIRSQKLSPNVTGISLDIEFKDENRHQIYIYVEARLALLNEKEDYIVRGFTNKFDVIKKKTLVTSHFARGSSEIYIVDEGYQENKQLRKKLENIANKNPMAPPGTYRIIMKVYDFETRKPIPGGDAEKTIFIPFSTVDEAFVEIIYPKTGSAFNNLAPTFNWTTSANAVRVSVFEALTNHRSPQDALTGGSPSLVRKSYEDKNRTADFSGTSLTYPADAERKLEQNKAYVLRVEARVVTNRGDVFRPSQPVVFRITDDKVGQMLDNFLNAFSGSAFVTYSSLRSEPSNWVAWPAYGNIVLDGRTINEADLQTLLNELSGRSELKLQLGIENQ